MSEGRFFGRFRAVLGREGDLRGLLGEMGGGLAVLDILADLDDLDFLELLELLEEPDFRKSRLWRRLRGGPASPYI